MANCLNNEVWRSKVPRSGSNEKGTFAIINQNANGDFTGEFMLASGKKDRIAGNCSPNAIWFDRPDVNPKFRYSGTFIYVNGVKHSVEGGRFKYREIKRTAKPTKRVADDWTGEKPPTIAASGRRKAAKKPGKKPAGKTKSK